MSASLGFKLHVGLRTGLAAHKAREEMPLHGASDMLCGSQGLGLVMDTLNSVTALLIFSVLSYPTGETNHSRLSSISWEQPVRERPELYSAAVLLSNTFDI